MKKSASCKEEEIKGKATVPNLIIDADEQSGNPSRYVTYTEEYSYYHNREE